jgi:hypothetical protein
MREAIMSDDDSWLLFWLSAGARFQYIVRADSLEAAKQQMAAKNLPFQTCGPVYGPGDGMPEGIWAQLDNE